jgi:hypothetical protein
MLLRSARVVRCDLVAAAAVAVVARWGVPCCSGEVVIAAVIPHGLFSHLRVGMLHSHHSVHGCSGHPHFADEHGKRRLDRTTFAVAAVHFELSADGVVGLEPYCDTMYNGHCSRSHAAKFTHFTHAHKHADNGAVCSNVTACDKK